MRRFSVSYDSTAKVITVVVCLMLAAIAVAVPATFVRALLPLLILLAYAYSPRGYEVSNGALVIRRLIGNVSVPLDSVREVRAGTPDDFRGAIRLFGNGGLFGYYGLFSTSKLGKCYWYVTNRSKSVIVVTASRTLVLSPDDVDDFLAELRPANAFPGGTAPRNGGNRSGMIVALSVAVPVIGLIALVMLYAPGPPPYTLSSGSPAIHDRFYPVTLKTQTMECRQIRIVDLNQESDWRPTLRTNGFANRRYQSGWFRVANGKTVRMYRAGSSQLVLIPPKGAGSFVLYQAKDPARFVEELRRECGKSGGAG